MRTIDFTPLLRSTVGFDRIERMLDSAMNVNEGQFSYPPYDIETLSENSYRITMAVAGFAEDEIEIVAKENSLTVTGKHQKDEADNTRTFLHRGIAQRAFERQFQLADYVVVKGASLQNGLLNIDLVREVPEALKPRKIEITSSSAPKALENKKAA